MSVPVLLSTGAISGFVRVSNYYDRTPLPITQIFNQVSLAPHTTTQRWAYTVPTARKSIVNAGQATVIRQTAAGTAGIVVCYAYYQQTLNIGPANYLVLAILITNAIGDTRDCILNNGYVLYAGQSVAASTADPSTGGTTILTANALFTEFDA